MTKDDLIRMADLAGYDVDDDDDVHAPASGRYGLDPRLEHFAQLVAEHTLQYKCKNVLKKSQNVDISEERVHETDKSIHELDIAERAYFAGKEAGVAECQWVSLTDEEIDYIWGISPGDYEDKFAFPRAIEAKVKEKNGG